MQTGYAKIINLPLLLTSPKGNYYFQQNDTKQLVSYKCFENKWHIESKDLLQEKTKGFEALLDNKGNAHVLGHTAEENLAYCFPPQKPLNIHNNNDGKVAFFSSLINKDDYLQLMLQILGAEKNIYCVYHKDKTTWHNKEPVYFFDRDRKRRDIKGLTIGINNENKIFLLLAWQQKGGYPLFYSQQDPVSGRWEEKTCLSSRPENAIFPDYLVDEGNNLHVSWVSHYNGAFFVNYACKTNEGGWYNHFNLQIKPPVWPVAPLFQGEEQIIMLWCYDNTIFKLYSFDRGASWKYDEKRLWGQKYYLCRYRHHPHLLGKTEIWNSNYTLIQKALPQTIFDPVSLIANDNDANSFPQEIKTLDNISKYIINQASSHKQSNHYLQQQLEQKEKDINRAHSQLITFKSEIQEKLTAKQNELAEAETHFEKALKTLQERLKSEQEKKEQLVLDQQKINVELRKQKEAHKKLISALTEKEEFIASLKERITSLEDEIDRLQNRGVFSKLFKPFSP